MESDMKEKSVWIVWCPQAGTPTYPHDSFESAKNEAERLARLNKGRRFLVMESIGHAVIEETTWVTHDNIPF